MSSLAAVVARSAPRAMSSLAATMTSGGSLRPARPASVTEAPRSRWNWAVCSNTNLYLSGALSSTLCTPLLRSIAGLEPGWPCRLKTFAPFGNSFMISRPWASPPRRLSAPTWARMPGTPWTLRSIVMTGILASTACCRAGAMATASDGEMMMPSTPWMIAASTSAVCLGVELRPSVWISLMLPSASASTVSCFCMCTKNGNSRLGSEVAMVKFCAAAPVASAEPARAAVASPIMSLCR